MCLLSVSLECNLRRARTMRVLLSAGTQGLACGSRSINICWIQILVEYPDIGGILGCALQSSAKREQKPKGFSWNPQIQAHKGRVSEWKLCLGRCSCWSLTLSGVRDQPPAPPAALMTSLLSFLSESQLKRSASWSAIQRHTHSSSTYAFLFHWINPYYMSLQMKKM